MWTLQKPQPVKLIIGILAANEKTAGAAVDSIRAAFGRLDMESPVWPFTHTQYYANEAGENMVKQFVAVEKLISPAKLAKLKLKTNKMEQQLAKTINAKLPRPVNLDPGYIEPSKLILASTKNFSHRIYIGKKIWAEVTLSYSNGWKAYDYTFPDHRENRYHDFFSHVRSKLNIQLKDTANK